MRSNQCFSFSSLDDAKPKTANRTGNWLYLIVFAVEYSKTSIRKPMPYLTYLLDPSSPTSLLVSSLTVSFGVFHLSSSGSSSPICWPSSTMAIILTEDAYSCWFSSSSANYSPTLCSVLVRSGNGTACHWHLMLISVTCYWIWAARSYTWYFPKTREIQKNRRHRPSIAWNLASPVTSPATSSHSTSSFSFQENIWRYCNHAAFLVSWSTSRFPSSTTSGTNNTLRKNTYIKMTDSSDGPIIRIYRRWNRKIAQPTRYHSGGCVRSSWCRVLLPSTSRTQHFG